MDCQIKFDQQYCIVSLSSLADPIKIPALYLVDKAQHRLFIGEMAQQIINADLALDETNLKQIDLSQLDSQAELSAADLLGFLLIEVCYQLEKAYKEQKNNEIFFITNISIESDIFSDADIQIAKQALDYGQPEQIKPPPLDIFIQYGTGIKISQISSYLNIQLTKIKKTQCLLSFLSEPAQTIEQITFPCFGQTEKPVITSTTISPEQSILINQIAKDTHLEFFFSEPLHGYIEIEIFVISIGQEMIENQGQSWLKYRLALAGEFNQALQLRLKLDTWQINDYFLTGIN